MLMRSTLRRHRGDRRLDQRALLTDLREHDLLRAADLVDLRGDREVALRPRGLTIQEAFEAGDRRVGLLADLREVEDRDRLRAVAAEQLELMNERVGRAAQAAA